MKRIIIFSLTIAALILAAATALAAPGGQGTTFGEDRPWRIRFLEAVVVTGPDVLLGEVAVPVGDMPSEQWRDMSQRRLWPSPPEGGKPRNMTRPKLQEAVVKYMKDLAPYCLFPGSMAIQREGVVIDRAALHDFVVRSLTPYLGGLAGEASLSDIRAPQYVFLSNSNQQLVFEPLKKVAPGRVSFRMTVRELDGKVVQKLTGSALVDCWVEVPCAAMPLNRGDMLEPDRITFVRTNLAGLKGNVWDGRGGPWRVLRPLSLKQVIYQTDLGTIPTVQKGHNVTLLYEGGTVALSVPAEAMEDGVVGESIQVRNLQSKKQVYAVVRDATTVVIKGRMAGQ